MYILCLHNYYIDVIIHLFSSQYNLFFCPRKNLAPMDSANIGIPCLGMFGGPAITNLVYGGYDAEIYEGAQSILLTLPLNNHVSNNTFALAWEKEFLRYMKVSGMVYSCALPCFTFVQFNHVSKSDIDCDPDAGR